MTVGRLVSAIAAFACASLVSARADAQLFIDTSFGVNGVAVTDMTASTTDNDTPADLLIQPDGQILTAGVSVDGFDNYIAMTRHSVDGVPDSAGFGVDGKVLIRFGFRDEANAIALQVDGKIVAAGMLMKSTAVSSQRATIYRFNADGTTDTSFAEGGWDSLACLVVSSAEFGGVTVRPDGEIVAAGRCNRNSVGGISGFSGSQFDSSGTQTMGFLHEEPLTFTPGSCAFYDDGRVLIANTAFLNGRQEFVIARVDDAGSLDAPFGIRETGIVAASNTGVRVLVQEDGKILLGGNTFKPNSSNTQFSVFRFDSEGLIDLSFGTNGRTDVSFTANDKFNDMALDLDGNILLVGQGNNQAGLARVLPDGAMDPTFSADGKIVVDVMGNSSHELKRVVVLPDGRILAAGVSGGNGVDMFLVRFIFDATVVEAPELAPSPGFSRVIPNPTSGETTIRLNLRRDDVVRVEVFDVAGRAVRRVFDGALPAGTHALRWDGRDAGGRETPAGIFFARVSTSAWTETEKVARIR